MLTQPKLGCSLRPSDERAAASGWATPVRFGACPPGAKTKPLPRTAGAEGYQVELEEDLQAQLHIESFAGADTRGTVEVANGVGDDAASGSSGAYARRGGYPVGNGEPLF